MRIALIGNSGSGKSTLARLRRFCDRHADWVIEGCYANCTNCEVEIGDRGTEERKTLLQW